MKIIASILRYLARFRFNLLGLATIKDIPTDRFKNLVADLVSEGWHKTYEYTGYDAWIDYGKIKLKKGPDNLTLEWDNWTEGSVEGPREILESIANPRQLEVTSEWRWSEYDRVES